MSSCTSLEMNLRNTPRSTLVTLSAVLPQCDARPNGSESFSRCLYSSHLLRGISALVLIPHLPPCRVRVLRALSHLCPRPPQHTCPSLCHKPFYLYPHFHPASFIGRRCVTFPYACLASVAFPLARGPHMPLPTSSTSNHPIAHLRLTSVIIIMASTRARCSGRLSTCAVPRYRCGTCTCPVRIMHPQPRFGRGFSCRGGTPNRPLLMTELSTDFAP
ncbi:hypothetical protein FA95DRAFT_334523 [Auriscalpium vulgare]|uniref:Uncharacterized protein n=1 Tax=Auriscalpium vulgare TaxID=40419 RepID=A0ACB8RIW1_9AGAM|nr:hypothetical protein FA95DRAFT_334523 [Auriscalpium vulgare]